MMNLEQLSSYCLSFPGATEEVLWQCHLVYKVGGKMFCMADLERPGRLRFKVDAADFESLIAETELLPAPHLARAHWLLIEEGTHFKKQEVQQFIATSYALVRAKLSKKIQAMLD